MDTAKHALIVCHPSPDSFTMAVAQRYAETVRQHRHDVVIRDLYALNFDPVLRNPGGSGHDPDVEEELAALAGTDVLVFIYPIWFGAPPAMLKGYIDRVLGAEFAFDAIEERMPHPLLAGKRLISFTSSGSLKAWLDERGVLMSMRNLFDRYLAEIFALGETEHVHFDGISDRLPEHEVQINLRDVEDMANEVVSEFAFSNR